MAEEEEEAAVMAEEDEAVAVAEKNEAAAAESSEAAAAEEAPPTMAEMLMALVRARTKAEGKLTPMDCLDAEGTRVEAEQQEALVAELLADERCPDIKLLRTSRGRAFLYSSDHMSDTYARILLRVQEDNPYETIASTVREESETYPRPTPLVQFKESTFGLDRDRVEELAREMIQLEQYGDVKLIQASTGALYLYSNRHLDAGWAKSLVEWQEVGRYQSL